MAKRKSADARVSSLEFFSRLKWLDGRPLLDTMEPYRRELFALALDTHDANGVPQFNFVLTGRGKKNFKSTDLILAGFYCLVIRESHFGNDGYIVANDEEQAGNDLAIAKKLVGINPELAADLDVMRKEIRRKDDKGTLQILPARDVAGAHGKTYLFLGFDEIHSYRNYDLIEALSPDPHRPDALRWVATYDGLFTTRGIPLVDFKLAAKRGDDPRMLASWYSGDWTTDAAFAELPPEQRANPSMASWPQGEAYLAQQRALLPTHKFRRLHLNLPGSPDGAFLDQGKVLSAIVAGRETLSPQEGVNYVAFVDMSGGSADDATLGIGHEQEGVVVLDLVTAQTGSPPFNPKTAVTKFAGLLKEYGLSSAVADAYAGLTFKAEFETHGIELKKSTRNKTQIYEQLEPALNAGAVELPDIPKLQEQLLTLVLRGGKIDHEPNGHDDWANAAAGVVAEIRGKAKMQEIPLVAPVQVGAGGAEYRQREGFTPSHVINNPNFARW